MYQPSGELLDKYAAILVSFALNSGRGVKPGEVVQCVVPDIAKPMYGALQRQILKAGAYPLMRLMASGYDRDFFELANQEQLSFFPRKYIKARVGLIDHSIGIIAEHDLKELKAVDPKKIMLAAESKKLYRDWLNHKEYAGKFTWTLALYGTEAMAKEAGMSLREYWQEIERACFLDSDNPIQKWQQIIAWQDQYLRKLNGLAIKQIRIQAKNTDLMINLGRKRKWVGGSCRNIPSFELFTSPDWRGTEGVIGFNQPLYRYGNMIENIGLEFRNGVVVKATARKNQKLLREMIARPNADKVGEFSLTDKRLSPIAKFMANTLFDENIGGQFGNAHIALGMAYKDTYDGDVTKVKASEWRNLGFNNSGEHCDIMTTTNRIVTARLVNGIDKVIYQDGCLVV